MVILVLFETEGEFSPGQKRMTEPNENNISQNHQDLDFETGIEVGREEQLDELANQLEERGYDSEEVNELLYDPAPRRRRGHRKAKRYDPAPKRHRRRRSRRYDPAPFASGSRSRGLLSKLKPLVGVTAGGVVFYNAYTTRAAALFASGAITTNSVMDAITYDLSHFSVTDAMNRVKASPGAAVTLVAGSIAKGYGILPKRGLIGLVVDAALGATAGMVAKQVLDPPIPAARQGQMIKRVGTGMTVVRNAPQAVQIQNGNTESNNVALQYMGA